MLSESDIKEIYKDIYASREYRKMADKYQQLNIQGNYAKAAICAKKMKEYEIGVFEGIARKYIDKNRLMHDWVSAMSEQDRKNLSILSYSIFMLSDVLETFIFDVNSLLKKYSDRKTVGFDKLNEALKEARKVVAHFDATMDDDKASYIFGDCSDNLHKLIFNKASSYMNKLKAYAKETNKNTPRDAKVA